MKTINKIIILALGVMLIFNSCSQNNFDEPPTKFEEKLETTISIKELKERFVVTDGFFSADPIQSNEQLVFNGIVTSTDIEGNVYKYIVVQEEEGTDRRAIRLSIDASGVASAYPLGMRVSVIANGLYIGKYGESVQMGNRYENNSGRVTPGNINYLIAKEKTRRWDFAPSAVVADTMTIAEILAKPQEEISYKLVCIKNAFFTGRGVDFNRPANISDAEKIFAPGTEGLNFPQSREIQDGSGASIFISTSEYARFATQPLPASSYVGDITALVTWYNNRDVPADPSKIYYQLTLRTLSDLGKGFEGYLEEINYKPIN